MMEEYMNNLFSLALGIKEPWLIKSISMKMNEAKNREEMHIDVDFAEGSRFSCNGEEGCLVHDTRSRTWRHLNFFQYRCYITARVPRVETKNGIRTVDVPWAREGSGFSLMMEGVILTLARHMPVRTVAREIGEHDTRIWRVIEHHVEEALEGQDFSDVTAVGVDEYSHKGHDYITVFLSHPDKESGSKARVLFVAEGKDKETVASFLERFREKRGNEEAVKAVTSDMSHGFESAMSKAFPGAALAVDKFHVVKNCSDAVDSVRRRECSMSGREKAKALRGTRCLWLKNAEKLTVRQRERLSELLQIEYLDTVKAYDMRLKLQDFYESSEGYGEETVERFESLALEFSNSPIRELARFGKLLTRNAVEILNYFETMKTNAILEGFNSKISLIKNRARGFRNLKNFMSMIYFCCGELALPFSPIM